MDDRSRISCRVVGETHGARRGTVDVRQRLRHDLPWVLALAGVVNAVLWTVASRFGWDSHAYWLAAQGDLYSRAPDTSDAYLYSPAFAQLIAPLGQLPWPVFATVFALVPAGLLAWMLRPLGLRLAVPLWLASTPEIASGNIFIALAALAVVGMRHPGAWTLSALTKVTPCLGPVWFAARGEWRRCAIALAATTTLVVASYVIAPTAWHDWVAFLSSHLGSVGGAVGNPYFPGPAVRLPVAVGFVIWGARTHRVWTLPLGMALATPVFGIISLTMLAAIPRLRARSDAESHGMAMSTARPASD